MSMIRWEPLSELRKMRDDMDRMFESVWRPSAMPFAIEGIAPAVDMFERDNNIMVKAEVPGLNKDDLDVTATDDSITLKGEFKKEEESKEEGFYRKERRSGRFFRTIPMPVQIQPDQVKATFKDGVLEITAPKSQEAKSNETKVPIET